MKPFIHLTLIFLLPSGIINAQEKEIITKAEDLPKHSYAIEIKDAQSFVEDDEAILNISKLVKNDLLEDLEKFDIRENATLREYYGKLCMLYIIESNYTEALAYIEKGRLIADKPSEEIMFEIESEALLNALMNSSKKGLDHSNTTIKNFLVTKLSAADFEVIQENIEYLKGRSQYASRNLFLGMASGDVQPALDNNQGKIPGNLIIQLIGFHYVLKYYIPYKDALEAAYQTVLSANIQDTAKVNIWKEREVTIIENAKYAPVLIGIWDTGVDTPVLPEKKQWKNPLEKFDGKDTDGNGFVDDVYGIAYDIDAFKDANYLEQIAHTMEDKELYQNLAKGYMDLTANVESEEASSMRKYMSEIKPEDVASYLDKVILFINYLHGTHVAGVAEAGNDMAKILSARMTPNYKAIPNPPTEEGVQRKTKAYAEIVDYFKKNNVRVVNMSWGYSYENTLTAIELNGIGKDDTERKALAKSYFTKAYNGFKKALESAPGILFVCAAGNTNDDVDFSADYPSSINLPNLITVGAVDTEGKKARFTTEGKSVDVYANGYEVESYVPGGEKMAFSGTSASSPKVANLAGKILAVYPQLKPHEVIDIIIKSSTTSEEDEKVLLIHPKKALELASTY
ncbi:MAG: S8 family serine peptidase [Bacteroidota bacterium]